MTAAIVKFRRYFGNCTFLRPQIDERPVRNSDYLDRLCDFGELEAALEILEQRHNVISRNNAYCLLIECCRRTDFEYGRRLQSLMLQSSLDSVAVLGDHLIRLFECMVEANQIFSRILQPSVYTWCAIFSSHVNHDQPQTAFELSRMMELSGVKRNLHVYVAIFKACAMAPNACRGRLIHSELMRSNIQPDVFVESAMVDMYAKSGSLEEAHRIFATSQIQNVVLWNTMMAGYVQNGEIFFAQECFDYMQLRGIGPDMVSWNTMIAGYAQHDRECMALECLENMIQKSVKPNRVTYLGILKACANSGVMNFGRHIHNQIVESGDLDISLGSALVDMYVKCGSLDEAWKTFTQFPNTNVVMWGAMLAGFAEHGEVLLALDLFANMQNAGVQANALIFTGILDACSSAGLVDDGCWYFHSMRVTHAIIPDVIHYNCMADLFIRAGFVREIERFLKDGMSLTIIGWKSLLRACQGNAHVELGSQCFKEIVNVDSHCVAAYVLLSNVYAANYSQEHDNIPFLKKYVLFSPKI